MGFVREQGDGSALCLCRRCECCTTPPTPSGRLVAAPGRRGTPRASSACLRASGQHFLPRYPVPQVRLDTAKLVPLVERALRLRTAGFATPTRVDDNANVYDRVYAELARRTAMLSHMQRTGERRGSCPNPTLAVGHALLLPTHPQKQRADALITFPPRAPSRRRGPADAGQKVHVHQRRKDALERGRRVAHRGRIRL